MKFMSILIDFKKSTIWAQSRLCASNRLLSKITKKKWKFCFLQPLNHWNTFKFYQNLIETCGLHLQIALKLWFDNLMDFKSDFEGEVAQFCMPKITKIYYFYHNHLLVVMNKPISQSLNWIEDCFSLLF